MTNQYIIPKKKQIFTSIVNNYFFYTKLTKYLKKKKSFISKLPKVYKRIIVSPNKQKLFCIKHDNHKYESVIKLDKKGGTIDINFRKGKNKKEKISLISKDKEIEDYTSSTPEDNNKRIKGRNIVIKKNNKIIKQLNDVNSSNNIDISIQFSDKIPNNFLKTRNMRRFPSSANKKKKNFRERLYKDLREINNKIKNKDDYLKKNFYNLQYQKHVGDIKTCPVCQEMRKKGILSEKEKGLHNTLSSRHLRNLNRRPLSKLQISVQQKGQETSNFNIFSTNNIAAEFSNKYLQFNGLNRPRKLIRYGSNENLNNKENKKRNFRTIKINMNRENEKNNLDDNDKWIYPSLNQYFHK